MAEENQTRIPAPRVPFLVAGSNVISREWFRYFQELATRIRLAESLTTIWFSGLVEAGEDIAPTNEDTHIYCTAALTITLQVPTTRNSELIVTNASDGDITFIGTVNGKTDMQIGCQWTSIRLRPTLTGWVAV